MPHQDELKPCLDRLNMDMMSEEELHARLQDGFDDVKAGRTRPAKEAFEEFRAQHNIIAPKAI